MGSCKTEQQPTIEMRETDNAREMGRLATACGLLVLAAFLLQTQVKGTTGTPAVRNQTASSPTQLTVHVDLSADETSPRVPAV